jgi:uncharacterized alpha-E superfamily protein
MNAAPLLSRVAHSIYWMQRYIERADNVARFILVNYNLALDMPQWIGAQWDPIIQTTGDHKLFNKRYKEPTEQNVLHFLLVDPEYSNSVLSCLRAAKENARCVQEAITSDVYEALNEIVSKVETFSSNQLNMENMENLLEAIKHFSHFVSGCMNATFNHDETWHFRSLGEFLERADKTTRILDVKYFYLYPNADEIDTPLEKIPWFSLLNSTSALEMYTKRQGLIQPVKVIEFLLLDPHFARSVSFCLEKALDALINITGNRTNRYTCETEKKIGALNSELKYKDVKHIIEFGIHEYLDYIQLSLNEIGASIQEDFFSVDDQSKQEQFQRIYQG